jgi:hypothetical protein
MFMSFTEESGRIKIDALLNHVGVKIQCRSVIENELVKRCSSATDPGAMGLQRSGHSSA